MSTERVENDFERSEIRSAGESGCFPSAHVCGECGERFADGFKLGGHTRWCDPARDRRIAEAYRAGATVPALQHRFKIGEHVIRGALKRTGTPYRRRTPPTMRAHMPAPHRVLPADTRPDRCRECAQLIAVDAHECVPVRVRPI